MDHDGCKDQEMKIGNQCFRRSGKTYVMGILNVTPDSFSDGGKWNEIDRALFQVEKMIQEGADLIDVGGESTRPGYTAVSVQEEIARVAPVINAIKTRFDTVISLDTNKSAVAEAGIEAGADLINDIFGLKSDDGMARVIAGTGVACCVVHNCREPLGQGPVEEIKQDLAESIRIAHEAGIDDGRIIIDCGIGFGKTYEQNLILLKNMESFLDLSYPLLLGCSRKSVIGTALGLPVEERLEGTLATTVMAALAGCSFVRVHDVRENVRALRMAESVINSENTRG